MSGCTIYDNGNACAYAEGHPGPHWWPEPEFVGVPEPVSNERFYRPSAIQARIEFLERHRRVIKEHMATRAEDEDFHGVSDDANDLREVDAELRGLRFVARQP